MLKFSKKYFKNLKMSRKCIKKYVNFSILVKKMKYLILYITPTYILRNDQICLRSPTTKLGHHLQTHILSNLQITMILVVTDPRPHLACQTFPVGDRSRGHHPKAESGVVDPHQQRRLGLRQLLKTT